MHVVLEIPEGMEIHQLRYLVAVAMTRSFSRAAERCHISQPSLSQQIQKLEQELGTQLFVRRKRTASLTPSGETLAKYATEILDTIEEAKVAVQPVSRPAEGSLRVGVIPTVAPYFLPHVIAQFAQSCPGVELSIHEDMATHLLDSLVNYEIDLAVLSLPVAAKEVRTEVLFTEELLLAVPSTHPLANKAEILWSDLCSEKFILLRGESCLSEQILTFCKRHHVRHRIIFRNAQLDTIQSLVMAGLGISLIPQMARWTARTQIIYRSFTKPRPSRSISAVWKDEQNRAAGEFLKQLRLTATSFAQAAVNPPGPDRSGLSNKA